MGPTVVITMQGIASRPPDVAYLNVGIITSDDASAASIAKNDEIFSALQPKLAALGIDGGKIKTTYYNVGYAARPAPSPALGMPAPAPQSYPMQAPRYGYVVSRQLLVTIEPIAKVGAAIDASAIAGATTVGNVQYALADSSAAYAEALASALRNAKSQAATVAQASGMHLGSVKQIQVQQQYMTPQPAPMRGPIGGPGPVANGVPATVEVRAGVVATYYLKP